MLLLQNSNYKRCYYCKIVIIKDFITTKRKLDEAITTIY